MLDNHPINRPVTPPLAEGTFSGIQIPPSLSGESETVRQSWEVLYAYAQANPPVVNAAQSLAQLRALPQPQTPGEWLYWLSEVRQSHAAIPPAMSAPEAESLQSLCDRLTQLGIKPECPEQPLTGAD